VSTFKFDPRRAKIESRRYQAKLSSELARAIAEQPKGSRLFIHVATGGGKTRIANDTIGGSLLPAGKRVLWVTKDWNLLQQAAADLAQRFNVARKLGFVGDRGQTELRGLRDGTDAEVVYTSIQTWSARCDDDLRTARFDVVFIDELHWGERAPSYKKLFERYRGRSVFVGLTATPHADTKWKRVGKAWTLGALIECDVLARPIVEKPLRTGTPWAPERSFNAGDFTGRSLDGLACDGARNRLIVETLSKRRHRYGQTIVFACNIAHAIGLARRMQRAGLSAEAVHSEMARADQREALENFRNGRTNVLVNVA
jgi:superfamily II DNA or RNA helicase